MENKMRRGIRDGVLLALLIIVSQPFHPTKGLIPELTNFLTSIPLWIAAIIFPPGHSPLAEGGMVLAYFMVVGALVGLAFERRALWGWLLIIALAMHHYIAYEQLAKPMGEVIQAILNHLS